MRNLAEAWGGQTMSTPEQRRKMAQAIINFEARRDSDGNLAVYKLPPGDGGGTYEVAGINDRYNKDTVDALVALIKKKKFEAAEILATEFIADDTERAASWTRIPALEFYLRDCVFNRGGGGAARILQAALTVKVDGAVGKETRDAMVLAEAKPGDLLAKLRKTREKYERDVAHRDESSPFWKGLVNRWNNALATAKTFPLEPVAAMPEKLTVPAAPAPVLAPTPAPIVTAAVPFADPAANAVLSALRIGMTGPRVLAWQDFLKGAGFDPGAVDGSFGERTRTATAAFQRKHKLGADGVAGRQTLLKAASLKFELIEEPADDNTSSNFPPRPGFAPLVSNAQREAIFGHYDYVPAPTPGNPEGIRILGGWESANMVSVPIPQLRATLGSSAPKSMYFHRLGAKQLQGLWADWEKARLLDRVLSYDGAFNPRFVRGSRTTLSNHAFGNGFDINYAYNKLGQRPALVDEKGSVRELVGIANDRGFWWGGHYENRKDGMHFEIAFVK
jgi:peptidoglycan hydrolase-like protein with peptidoglycan-binding domain